MAVAGASITAARIFTLSNGMALDSFYVEDAHGGAFDQPGKLARLSAAIEQSLTGRLKHLQDLQAQQSPNPRRFKVFKVSPRSSEERRVGKESVSTYQSRWTLY